MDDNTEGQYSLFAGERLASHTVSPGSSEARKMTAISGRRCYELYGRFSQLGCLAKTCLESSVWNSTSASLIWKKRVTPQGRLLFQLVPQMPTTFAIESGFVPTPTAQPYGTGQNGQRKDGTTFKGAGMPSLHTMARHNLWPTPTQNGNYNRKGLSKNSGDGLATAVKMWPTPRGPKYGADPKKLIREKRKQPSDLESAVALWPTPAARDWKDGRVEGIGDRNTPNLGRVVGQSPNTGSLNPTWVEWLMGFPIGWTDLKD